MFDLSFYKDKKVLITGNTGFKGSWMTKTILMAGADVIGYSLLPPTEPALFNILGLDKSINSIYVEPCREDKVFCGNGSLKTVIGDILNLEKMIKIFEDIQPEIVIHMAAQPLVRESYKDPVGTYMTNVIGTVNVLECVRNTKSVRSFVNVTTDKVYLNKEHDQGYSEEDVLNGYDPYSNSKSCSELVTACYKNSFFSEEINEGRRIAISTMRAGNVVGGGDYAIDRIIPDCIRAAVKNENIIVRNPYSIRPYQHVLEPVMAYLMVAAKQYENIDLASSYNVGPDDADCKTTGDLVQIFCDTWGNVSWKNISEIGAPHEATFLKLDSRKIKETFGWAPRWSVKEAIEKIVEWYKSSDFIQISEKQITDFFV